MKIIGLKLQVRKSQIGATLVEYLILLSLIAVICIPAIRILTDKIKCNICVVNACISVGTPYSGSCYSSAAEVDYYCHDASFAAVNCP